MRKAVSVLLVLVLVFTALTGCSRNILGNKVKVYTFSGETGSTEDRKIRVTNGVIVIAPSQYIFYEGNIDGELTQKQKEDGYDYSVTYWVKSIDEEGKEKEEVLAEQHGNIYSPGEFTVDSGASRGKTFVDVEKLKNNLYCRVAITDKDKKTSTYEIPMMIDEITESK